MAALVRDARCRPACCASSRSWRRPTRDSIAPPLLLRTCVRAAPPARTCCPSGFGRQLVPRGRRAPRALRPDGRRRAGAVVPRPRRRPAGRARRRRHRRGHRPGARLRRPRRAATATAGWSLWLATGPPARRRAVARLRRAVPRRDLDALVAQDPMYALLGQLARDGTAGRAHVHRPRARPLPVRRARRARRRRPGDHERRGDGGRRARRRAAAAGAPPRSGLARGVGFVNLFGRDNAARRRPRRPGVARRRPHRGRHAPLRGPARRSATGAADRSDRIDRRPARVRRRRRPAPSAELAHQVFADGRTSAVFDPHALGAVLDLAARTDAGVAVLRTDLAGYQRGLAAAAAAAGRRRRRPGVAAPRRTSRRRCSTPPGSRAASSSTSATRPSAAAAMPTRPGVLDRRDRHGRRAGRRAVRPDRFGGRRDRRRTGDRARRASARRCRRPGPRATVSGGRRLAGERLAYVWFRELHDAGLLGAAAARRASSWTAGSRRTTTSSSPLATGGPPGWTVSTVLQELDDAPGGAVDIDGRCDDRRHDLRPGAALRPPRRLSARRARLGAPPRRHATCQAGRHAARHDRPRPDGRQHGPSPGARRPRVRRLRRRPEGGRPLAGETGMAGRRLARRVRRPARRAPPRLDHGARGVRRLDDRLARAAPRARRHDHRRRQLVVPRRRRPGAAARRGARHRLRRRRHERRHARPRRAATA